MSKTELTLEHFGRGTASAVGARAGQFIFLGAQTPMDLETGTLGKGFKDVPESARRQLATGMVFIDATEQGILTQTWQIYENVKRILAAHGASLDDLVHQRIFLKRMRHLPSLERVMRAFMPQAPPSTTILEATNPGVNPEIEVQADFIAAAPGGPKRVNISLPDLDHLTAPYPLATRAGQYVFTSTLAGVDPKTGKIIESVDALTAEERELLEPPYPAKVEAAVAQHLMLFRHVRRILESQGAPLGSHIHQNGWLRIPMQEFGPIAKVRRRLFAGRPNQAPSTALPVAGVRQDGALFEWQVVALVPPRNRDEYRKDARMPAHPLTDFYLPAVNAGPFVFTAGEVAVETSGPSLVNRFSEVQDEGRFLSYGRIHQERPIMAESWHVYQQLKSYLEACGSSMDQVLHQTLHMVNPADYPALERIATLFYGPKLPPTTVVPIVGTSPYPEATLEAELVAVAM